MKHILIINGHPNKESFNYALHQAFKRGIHKHTVEEMMVTDLQFDLNLAHGYKSNQPLEPDLIKAQQSISKADHIVWIYPMWWGAMPALLKGFIDRVLLPGFAFKYRKSSNLWDKLLAGKTTEIICTTDYPIGILKWYFGEGGVKVMRKMILDFCGLKTLRTTYIGPVRPSTPEQREKWLLKVEQIAGKI